MSFLFCQDLSSGDYEEWLEQHRHAETALHDRERLLHVSAHKLECNLELLGATGIEDRLQDGVPETIARLREAGLKVWVLTGDKQVIERRINHNFYPLLPVTSSSFICSSFLETLSYVTIF